MQRLIRIHAIRDRAAALRLTVKELCSRAQPPVPDSTIGRWLSGAGRGGPRIYVYEDFCNRLEAALDRIEGEELGRLSQRGAISATGTVAK